MNKKLKSIFLLVCTTFSLIFMVGMGKWVIQVARDYSVIKNPNEPVAYIKSTNQKFMSIEKALEVAGNDGVSTEIFVIPGTNPTISKNCVIKNSDVLYIPYENETVQSFDKSGTLQRQSLVKLTNGADLTIESGGKLIVGGVIGTRGVVGKYSELSLDKNSSINVNGELEVYGMITEINSIVGNNDCYDNSNDSERYVEVSNTGKVTTTLASYDMGSGTAILNKINAGICPTYNFDFPALKTYMKFNYGSILEALAYVEISGMSKSALCGIIYPDGSSQQSIFYQKSGVASFEYCSSSKTIIYLDGDIKIGSLYIDASVATIDTSKMVLPFHGKYAIFINSSLDTNNKSIKFLPGAYVEVLENGVLDINGIGTTNEQFSKVFFYSASSLTSIGINNYGTKDSTLINNGQIVVNEYGGIGGYIQTERIDGGALIDLDEVSSNSSLSLSTLETINGDNIPPLDFIGPFYDESTGEIMDNKFISSSKIYSYQGQAAWDLEGTGITKQANIHLTVLETNYKFESFNYSVFTNTSATDNNQTIRFEEVNTTREQNFLLEIGNYIKIEDRLAQSITINGNPYISGNWYLVESNLDIEIMPSESYQVSISVSNGQSGNGYAERYIEYGPTTEYGYKAEPTTMGGSISVTIPINWHFRVYRSGSMWNTDGGYSSVIKTTYNEDGSVNEEEIAYKEKGYAWNSNDDYIVDASYTFKIYGYGGACLVEGTLITMADGSQKKIEDLKVGDAVMVFNHATGKFDTSFIAANVHEGEEARTTNVINLVFDNGQTTRISFEHGFFDVDKNEYVYINESNYQSMIGHRFYNLDNEAVTLIDAYITEEAVKVYSPVSYKHLNIISDNLISIGGDLRGLFNIFELNDDMTINIEKMNEDIATYGLYTYEDWEDYLTKEEFDAFNAKYLKVSIGKGLTTKEEIIRYIESYL